MPEDSQVLGGYVSVAAGSVAAVKWTPVFHMRHMSLLGYFPQVTFGSAATAEQQQGCLQQAHAVLLCLCETIAHQIVLLAGLPNP